MDTHYRIWCDYPNSSVEIHWPVLLAGVDSYFPASVSSEEC